MRRVSAKPLSLKLLLACFAAGFGIFFGVDVATRGIERVNGPMDAVQAAQQPAQSVQASAREPQPGAKGAPAGQKTPAASPAAAKQDAAVSKDSGAAKQQAMIEESAVNRVSNGIGDFLRRISSVLLKLAVSVFESIFG